MPKSLSTRLQTLLIALMAVLAVFIASGVIVYMSLVHFDRQQAWVDHTHRVILELEKSLSSLKDAESSLRGYIISGAPSFRANLETSVEDSVVHLRRLKDLTVENSEQQLAISKLESTIASRIRLLQDAVGTSDRRTFRAAPDTIRNGAKAMEEVRGIADEIEGRERRYLAVRVSEAGSRRFLALGAIVLASVLNILMAIALYWFIRKNFVSQAAEAHAREREARMAKKEAVAAQSLAGDQSLGDAGNAILRFLGDELGFPIANVYVESDERLLMIAGVSRSASETMATLKIGDGLIGRAALAQAPLRLDHVPPDYFHRIESSLGESAPKSLVFFPLRFRGRLVGLLEVAGFESFDREGMETLERVSHVLSGGLDSARSQQRLQTLLEETQRQAEELQMQQEELRTTNEELSEQSKALLETQDELQVQAEELRQANEELEQQAKTLEAQQETLSLKNDALEGSRRKIAEKVNELERANAYKSEFLAKMSHELRTPLNSIMILATLLKENKFANLVPQQVEFARTIHDAGVDLLSIINDILDLSKLEARKLEARPEPFALEKFIDQVSTSFRLQAEQKGLVYESSVEEDAKGIVVTDRQRLLQIVRNLLSNAIKFTERGRISVRAFAGASADRIRIEVSDSGVGIPENKKRLIWEAFEQADGSVSRKYGGTGLGLTISRELAFLLGGQISVESEVGEGSRFTLELPRDLAGPIMRPAPIERRAERPTKDEGHGATGDGDEAQSNGTKAVGGSSKGESRKRGAGRTSKTILIVEDDSQFREVITDVARSHGFQPIEAWDEESALAALKTERPQAVLLDLSLADHKGMRLLEWIRANPDLGHIPVHAISKGEGQHEALRMGAIGYLTQTASPDGLRSALDRIENLIDGRVKRLLVVEDDATQSLAIQSLVASSDTEILAVSTGREAIETLKRTGVDCIILDLRLPDISGFEFLEKLALSSGLSMPPVIVHTGQDLTREEEDRLRRFSDSIIIKGGKSPERLLDEVNLFLRRVEKEVARWPSREAQQAAFESTATERWRDSDGSSEFGTGFEGKRLLVVDDDLRNLFALTSALEARGFKVTVARDGIEALGKLEDSTFDAILTDIMMPKMDGFELMKKVRAKAALRSVPIIALTAKTMKGEQEKCIVAGANDYLAKPIELASLLSMLNVWLAQATEARSTPRRSRSAAEGVVQA